MQKIRKSPESWLYEREINKQYAEKSKSLMHCLQRDPGGSETGNGSRKLMAVISNTSEWRPVTGGIDMRTMLIAGLTAVGLALAATSGVSAAPANGTVIGDVAKANGHVTTVQHWRWGSGGHWRYRSRGY